MILRTHINRYSKKSRKQVSHCCVPPPTSAGNVDRGRGSLVRTASAGAKHSGANLLREQGAGGSNPLAPTIHKEAVPPGAAFSFLPSGPRPVLPVVLAAFLEMPTLSPYVVPVRGKDSGALPGRGVQSASGAGCVMAGAEGP